MAIFNGKTVGFVCKTELPPTFVISDSTGYEAFATYAGEEPILTATANDIREGTVAGTNYGVTVGTKVIPSYHTSEGYTLIRSGYEFAVPDLTYLDCYDYTKLQIIICPFAGSIAKSVSAEKVIIEDNVYSVQSDEPIAQVSIDYENKTIKLNIINDSDSLYLIRYFTYKEIY